MPRICTICTHTERAAIEASLLADEPLRDIAGRTGTTKSALDRHRDHIPKTLAKAKDAVEVSRADDLLAKVQGLEADARRIAAAAEESDDLRTALAGVRELTRIVELLARLRGELQESTTVNVLVAPEWLTLRTRIIEALASYPEARAALAGALGG